VSVRLPAVTKRELEAVAREHGRSVDGECRAAIDAWLDVHKRELLAAWHEEEAQLR
jgi:plasmid stability protein